MNDLEDIPSINEIRKILEALRGLLPAMNREEVSAIGKVIYEACARLEKEAING